MNYTEIKDYDTLNGAGIRVTLIISGCGRKCQGCNLEENWDYNYGQEFTRQTMENLLIKLKPKYIQGFTLTGGEPLEFRNLKQCTEICQKIKKEYPNKDIWLYTGFKWETVSHLEIFRFINVVVDNPYDCKTKDITLKYKTSHNQRIIDVQKSLNLKQTIEV